MNEVKFHKFLLELYVKRKARGEEEYYDYAKMHNKLLPRSKQDHKFYFLPWEMTLEECLFIAKEYHREYDVQRYLDNFPNATFQEALEEFDCL